MTLPNPPNRPLSTPPSGTVRQPPPLRPPASPVAPARPGIPVPPKPAAPDTTELEPIGLVEGGADVEKKIKAFGLGKTERQRDWKRKTNLTGTGANRLKSFHGKLSEEGLGYLDEAINDWLDSHPEVEVKLVTSTVGTFEGKIRMPALILNLWY